ncbi:tetratricopeptide repeat protein [Streptomyces sp. DH12]|uniref:tetratricopeptide repeat protein n=1 Tax=Streptomyces sp. DH12 TaxID=2857010 RepID=UPI001E4B2CD8|nr:tetratricopeptide repeat protein [Streptomyces sp. DH12]
MEATTGHTGETWGTAAERWERAGRFFAAEDHLTAAALLDGLVREFPDQNAARLLLARAYYHSARLGRAEAELRALIDRDRTDAYAHLLLGRTLERRGRAAEAAPYLRIAELWGLSA